MARLDIMVGIPGSGKTSYALNNLITSDTIYLSSDDTRKRMYGFESQTHNAEVFASMEKDMVKALEKGKHVVYDATNLHKKRRVKLIQIAKKYKAEVNAYLCCTPINTILERNITRTERKIPRDKLLLMIQSIEPPMYYEGFDNIYLIDGGMYNDIYDYNFLIRACVNYQQDNPYHIETLEEHIKAVVKRAEDLGEKVKLCIDTEILRQAARHHDFGKLYTRTFNEKKGYSVYYGHENVSTYLFMCHVRKQNTRDDLDRVRLNNRAYQTGALILNHMEWYHREDMTPIREMFNDDDLYVLLELLHEADIWGRNENAIDNSKILAHYKNGNYMVTIYDDGTKRRKNDLDFFEADRPESIDCKISNRCPYGCPECHEMSTPDGILGDIMNEPFIDKLHAGMEMAIGGGAVTAHPDLVPFLTKLKQKGVLPSITVNQREYKEHKEMIDNLVNQKLIYGLGVSFTNKDDEFWKEITSKNKNVVVHLIAGYHDLDVFNYLTRFSCKILILGFKNWGRGQKFLERFNKDISHNIEELKANLPTYINTFPVVSFDNLAIGQLHVKELLNKEEWNRFYQGDDGTHTMYVDLVKRQFAKTSTSPTRYDLLDDLDDMFKIIKEEK